VSSTKGIGLPLRLAGCLLCVLVAWLAPGVSARAAATSACEAPSRDHWTSPEAWVLSLLCNGEIADFNRRAGKALDPRAPTGWTTDRELSADFLKKLLLSPGYQPARAQGGVRIIGAWIRQEIDLEGARIGDELWFERSRLDAPFILERAQSNRSVGLGGSRFGDASRLSQVELAGALLAADADFQSIDLRGASIAREADFRGAQVHGGFDASEIQVGRFLDMPTRVCWRTSISLVRGSAAACA
jgi:hypothetical protein